MSAHVLPPLAVDSKSERKVNSLPPLVFELAIGILIGMLAHLSNHSTKSHPNGTELDHHRLGMTEFFQGKILNH
jgi:hypothetical protein